MNVVEIDASRWKTGLDVYEGLLEAVDAPFGHGRNINALIDSMVYGGINGIEPPYLIVVRGAENLPDEARNELIFIVLALGEAQWSDNTVQFQGTL